MNVVIVVELLILIFVVWTLLSQVILPAANGRPVFPMLRGKAKLEAELSQVKEARDEQALKDRIAAEKAKLNKGE